jgi:peptidoglycan L-alanyl-D-glutamate endopeptidase CwlK
MFIFGSSSLRNRQGIDPRVIEISDLALGLSLIDFGIPKDGGLREAERQNELFKLKRSKCDGYKNISAHQKGLAIDIYAYIDGHASWDEDHLAMVACAMLQAASQLGYSLEWGGLWRPPEIIRGIPRGWDMGHFELVE